MRLVASFAFGVGLFCALAAEAAAQGGNGLTGTYSNYTGNNPPAYPAGNPYGTPPNPISGTAVTRTDLEVNFDWADAVPIAGVTADNFYVVWTGYLLTTAAGPYQFWEETDDGGHFYIRPIGGAWNPTSTFTNWAGEAMNDRQIPFLVNGTATNQITLEGGRYYEIRFEMYDSGSLAGAKLRWQPPGGMKAIIPQAQLFTTVTLPAAPVLSGTPIVSGADLSWTTIAAATAGYQLFMGTAPGVYNPTPIYAGPLTAFTQNGLTYGQTYYFVVQSLTTTGLSSAYSNMVTISPIVPPPRTNSHSEGLLDDKCACGSSIPGPLLPGLAGLAGLAILAATRRRK